LRADITADGAKKIKSMILTHNTARTAIIVAGKMVVLTQPTCAFQTTLRGLEMNFLDIGNVTLTTFSAFQKLKTKVIAVSATLPALVYLATVGMNTHAVKTEKYGMELLASALSQVKSNRVIIVIVLLDGDIKLTMT